MHVGPQNDVFAGVGGVLSGLSGPGLGLATPPPALLSASKRAKTTFWLQKAYNSGRSARCVRHVGWPQ
eukprot:8308432-Karenia_brevis.AAC.1